MRRREKEISREAALEIIDRCKFATLATVGENMVPYAVPLSMARKDDVLYFHGAKEGHKTTNLNQNANCCVSFVGETKVPEGKFDISYESVTVFGKASQITDKDEKTYGLKVISERYTPDNMANFDKVVEVMLERVAVWKISMDLITGKKN